MTLALLAFGLSFILNLIIILVARRLDWFIDSLQKPQKFHSNPTPRAGGIGIFLPFLCLNSWLYLQNPSPLILGLLCGGGIVFLSGIVEDFNASLSPKFRLFLQCLGSGIFIALSGIYLKDLGFGIHLPSYLGIPFTLFALVGMINALNIIDGFNGLASGIALIALILIISLGLPSPLSLSILILIASILGFWLLNFPFGKIFLGDGGAYFLGFILASLLVGITQNPIGGGGSRSLAVVWDRNTHLPLLGSDLLHLSQKQTNPLSSDARQCPSTSTPLSEALQNSICKPSHFSSASYDQYTLYASSSIPSQRAKCPSSSLSSLYSLLSPPLSQAPISPWFGLALLIYPFWEVLFSIYRKKFIRHISPMQPDEFHIHMLIHRYITHHNAKTSLLILSLVSPFMILARILYAQSLALVLLIMIFILGYLLFYRRLSRFVGKDLV